MSFSCLVPVSTADMASRGRPSPETSAVIARGPGHHPPQSSRFFHENPDALPFVVPASCHNSPGADSAGGAITQAACSRADPLLLKSLLLPFARSRPTPQCSAYFVLWASCWPAPNMSLLARVSFLRFLSCRKWLLVPARVASEQGPANLTRVLPFQPLFPSRPGPADVDFWVEENRYRPEHVVLLYSFLHRERPGPAPQPRRQTCRPPGPALSGTGGPCWVRSEADGVKCGTRM